MAALPRDRLNSTTTTTTKKKPLTILTGFISPPPGQTEVDRGTSPIYSHASNHTNNTIIGTFFLSCSIIHQPGFDVFDPCQLYFYFHPVGAIQKTTDILTATGVSVIANLANLTQPPILQKFVVTGGTGKYLGARGVIVDDYATHPGLNTFQVYLVK